MKILRVDTDERKIGLSRKRVEWTEEDRGEPGGDGASAGGGGAGGAKPAAASQSTPATDLKGGIGGGSGPLIKPASSRRSEKAGRVDRIGRVESSLPLAESRALGSFPLGDDRRPSTRSVYAGGDTHPGSNIGWCRASAQFLARCKPAGLGTTLSPCQIFGRECAHSAGAGCKGWEPWE